MAYIGNKPIFGSFRKIDNISSSFNGVLTQFSITSGGVPVYPVSATQLLLSLNGVIQEPGVDFDLGSTSNSIEFSSAVPIGSTFFAVMAGDSMVVGTPSDGTVTSAKLTANSVTDVKIVDGAVTTAKVATGAITDVKLASNSVTNSKLADNSITLQKIQNNAVTTDKIANSAVTDFKIADGNVNFLKLASSMFATVAEIVAGTASKIITAASMAPLLYGTELYQSAGTAIASSTWTLLLFGAEAYDDGGWHSTSSNTGRITVDFTGRIFLEATCNFNTLQNGTYSLRIKKNGNVIKTIEEGRGVAATVQILEIVGSFACVATDYFEVEAYQNGAGGGTTTVSGTAGTTFKGRRIK